MSLVATFSRQADCRWSVLSGPELSHFSTCSLLLASWEPTVIVAFVPPLLVTNTPLLFHFQYQLRAKNKAVVLGGQKAPISEEAEISVHTQDMSPRLPNLIVF